MRLPRAGGAENTDLMQRAQGSPRKGGAISSLRSLRSLRETRIPSSPCARGFETASYEMVGYLFRGNAVDVVTCSYPRRHRFDEGVRVGARATVYLGG